jgi:hypothetical protein
MINGIDIGRADVFHQKYLFVCARSPNVRRSIYKMYLAASLSSSPRRPPQTTHDVISIQYTRVVYISYSVYARRQGQRGGGIHQIRFRNIKLWFGKKISAILPKGSNFVLKLEKKSDQETKQVKKFHSIQQKIINFMP